MERTLLIQHYREQWELLEKELQSTIVDSWRWKEISKEISILREKLADTMNSVCPIIKDSTNG